MTTDPVPQLVGHRGDMVQYPENSWPALRAAVAAGACWLEFDVQMCADGGFILLHDANFRRTASDPRRVFELDAQACSRISVHFPERFDEHFFPAPAPLLDEVLEWLSAYPEVRAMVEIKTESLKHFGRETVMRALLKVMAPHRDQCVLISFDAEALRLARKQVALELGWVLHKYNGKYRKRAERLNPHYLICNHKKIPHDETPWPGDWQWMLYDIRDPQQALAWARRGVGLIESGDICRLLKHPRLAVRACRHGL